MTTENTDNKAPTHELFHVVGDGKKGRWTKIGVGWSHQDSKGMNLTINYTPLQAGRFVTRQIEPKEEAQS